MAEIFNVSTDYLLCRVESKEISNTEISKSLGLSDKALEKLQSFLTKDSYQLDVLYGDFGNYQDFSTIINSIIENDNFEKLIYFIRAYINSFRIIELEKEIKYNSCPEIYEHLYDDEDCDSDFNYSKSDIYSYRINKIHNKIIDEITDKLKDYFSKHWTLNKEKTEILRFCNDGSEKIKMLKGRGIKKTGKGDAKKNGSKGTNKK